MRQSHSLHCSLLHCAQFELLCTTVRRLGARWLLICLTLGGWRFLLDRPQPPQSSVWVAVSASVCDSVFTSSTLASSSLASLFLTTSSNNCNNWRIINNNNNDNKCNNNYNIVLLLLSARSCTWLLCEPFAKVFRISRAAASNKPKKNGPNANFWLKRKHIKNASLLFHVFVIVASVVASVVAAVVVTALYSILVWGSSMALYHWAMDVNKINSINRRVECAVSVFLFISLPVCMLVCLSICLPVRMSAYISETINATVTKFSIQTLKHWQQLSK